jgi:hypothetical protein
MIGMKANGFAAIKTMSLLLKMILLGAFVPL